MVTDVMRQQRAASRLASLQINNEFVTHLSPGIIESSDGNHGI